jgi:glutamine synthetase
MAFGNPRRESFARLIQGKEAPGTIVWGESDRSALVRLPATVAADDGRRITAPTIEFRLPDGSAFPHFLLAGVAQAMAYGSTIDDLNGLLERRSSLRSPDPDDPPARVARSFAEVADELERHRSTLEAGEVFPAALVERLLERLRG